MFGKTFCKDFFPISVFWRILTNWKLWPYLHSNMSFSKRVTENLLVILFLIIPFSLLNKRNNIIVIFFAWLVKVCKFLYVYESMVNVNSWVTLLYMQWCAITSQQCLTNLLSQSLTIVKRVQSGSRSRIDAKIDSHGRRRR